MGPELLLVAGTLIGAAGEFSAGNYQAAVADQNAKINRNNAALASEIAQRDQLDIAEQQIGLQGETLAAQGASGVEINSPSFVRTRMRMADLAYEDQVRRIEAGNRQRANFLTKANVFEADAKQGRKQAKIGLAASFATAGSSLIGGSSPTALPNYAAVPTPRPTFYGGTF